LSTLQIDLTDPAKELAALGRHFLQIKSPKQAPQVFQGLAAGIGIKAEAPELLEILAAIGKRAHNLRQLALKLDSQELEDNLRKEIVRATAGFDQLINHRNAHAIWETSKVQFLPEENLAALRWFGPTAQKHRPLRVISEKDRETALAKIVETISSIENDADLEAWMRAPLVEGLERARLILQFLVFFGHDIAITDLFLIHERVAAIATRVGQHPEASKGWQSFKDTLLALSLAGNLFILPDQAVTAFNNYTAWGQSAILAVTVEPSFPTPQRLLAAPAAIIPRDTKIIGEEK
jgi:hypothetical protein